MTHYRVSGRSDRLERLYSLGQQYGVGLLPLLTAGGNWRDKDPDTLYQEHFELARSRSRQHRGRFPVWECGNELENHAILQPCEMRDDHTQYPCDWAPATGDIPLDYSGDRFDQVSAVVRGLVNGVGEGDPDAKRAIGTAGWGHIAPFEMWQDRGIDWEITVWHDYETVSEDYLKTLASFGKPIWITEFNAGGGGTETEAENARLIRERIAYYREMAPVYDIEAAFVYELLDEPYWSGFESMMGLYRMEGSDSSGWRVGNPKPAGTAVQEMLSGG